MYQRCLIAVFLTICIFGCNAPAPEETAQDPNVTPEGVRITPDVVYGHKFGMALTFDMYQPKNQNGAGVIFINSGGWSSKIPNFYKETAEGLRLITLEEYDQTTTPFRSSNIISLIEKGFTVFAVRHGSVPKFEMAEIVLDVRRAIRFIRFYARDYGVDVEKLGIWGGSAGGHLALLLGTTAEIGNTEANEDFEKSTGRVAAVVAYFPPTDLKKGVDDLRKKNPNFLKDNPVLDLGDELLREFSPINHVSSDDPPTLIIHGDKDQRVPISVGESMFHALKEAGVNSKFIAIPGGDHGFSNKDDADQAVAEMVNWFEEHLVEK